MSEPEAAAVPYRRNRPELSGPWSRGSSTWYWPWLICRGASQPSGTTVLNPFGPETCRYPGGSGPVPEGVGDWVLGGGIGEELLGGVGAPVSTGALGAVEGGGAGRRG